MICLLCEYRTQVQQMQAQNLCRGFLTFRRSISKMNVMDVFKKTSKTICGSEFAIFDRRLARRAERVKRASRTTSRPTLEHEAPRPRVALERPRRGAGPFSHHEATAKFRSGCDRRHDGADPQLPTCALSHPIDFSIFHNPTSGIDSTHVSIPESSTEGLRDRGARASHLPTARQGIAQSRHHLGFLSRAQIENVLESDSDVRDVPFDVGALAGSIPFTPILADVLR